MRWQKQARIGVAIVGLGCAAAVYLMAGERKKPTPVKPPEQLRDEKATSESLKCSLVHYKNDVKSYTLNCGHMASYADGRTRFEKAILETMRDGENFKITADVAEKHGRAVASPDDPGEVALTGNVRVETSKGLVLLSDAATYTDKTGHVVIPGPLTFTRGRLSGEGVGGTYDRTTEVLWLLKQSHVRMSADADGGGAFDATSNAIALYRPQRYIRFDTQASIVRDRETMSADAALMYFTDDEQNLKKVDLRGHSSVVPRGDPVTAPPEMRADDIVMAFHPNSRTISQSTLTNNATLVQTTANGKHTIVGAWIDARTGTNGQTLTGLDAKTNVSVALPGDAAANTPPRTITAQTLTAQGTEKAGLTSALFDGGVQFTEQRTPTRGQPASVTNGTSKSLVLALTGGLDGIDEARFVDTAKFTKGAMAATGDVAIYHAKKQTLRLEPAAKPVTPLHAEDTRVTVDARDWILLFIDTEDVSAKGAVSTTMRPAAPNASRPSTPGLFETGKKTTGSAEDFNYLKGVATYKGTPTEIATVSQEGSRVDAEEIRVEDQTGNLSAKGRVKSTILMEKDTNAPATSGAAPAAPAKPHVATGKTLVYRDDRRLATYTGDDANPASLEGETRIEAVKIDITLAKQQRTVERIEADRDAHAWFEGKREVRGNHLTYVSATAKYVLTGNPALVKQPNDKAPTDKDLGCTLSPAVTVMYENGAFNIDPGRAATGTTDISCDQPLPRKLPVK